MLNLKEMLPYLETGDTAPVYDGGVAGYLLNPLKDTYGYDDLARDYLGLTVPSRADLLAKADLGDALWNEDARAVTCACYMAYTVWKAAAPLTRQLKDTGMYALYKEIEMPLIYSLYHMEQEGVKVERAELEEYGNRLKVRIVDLEQEIYRDTGKEFNINSPKQLGEILFEDMKIAAMLQNGAQQDPLALLPMDALRMATVNGARALGRNTGRIAPGCDADLILVDFGRLNLIPCHDVVSNLVYAAHGCDVVMNMCRGKVIYRNGDFLTIDIERVKREVADYALPLLFG